MAGKRRRGIPPSWRGLRTPGEAVGAIRALPTRLIEGGTALALCNRVGSIDLAVFPPGTRHELANCSRCGEAVWIDPEPVAECRARGLALDILCEVCHPDDKPVRLDERR